MYMQNMGLKKQLGKIWIAIIEIKLKPCLVGIVLKISSPVPAYKILVTL